MPRHEDAGLLNTKSTSSDLSTSTMKADPGGPERVPGLAGTLPDISACAAAVEGRLTKAAVSASAAFARLTAGIAVAAPATAAPARNLRRSTPVLAFLRAIMIPSQSSDGRPGEARLFKIYHAAAACPIRLLCIVLMRMAQARLFSPCSRNV